MSNCQIYELIKKELQVPNRAEVIGVPKCQIPVLASDPDCLCLLHSRNPDKDGAAFNLAIKEKLDTEDYDFREVFFPGPISFEAYIFNKEADFSSAKFMHDAKFEDSKFIGDAIFAEAEFSGHTSFVHTDFDGKVNFCAKFNNSVSFYGTKFKGMAEFTTAEFHSTVSFRGAYFYNDVDFSWTIFNDKVLFDSAEFHEKVVFDSINSPSDEEPKYNSFYGEFTYLKFGPKVKLVFRDSSLAYVKFEDTDLRYISFKNIIWYQYQYYVRNAIYDEILLHKRRWAHITYVLHYGWLWGKRIPGEKEKDIPKKPTFADFAQVERLYRQLKTNYEEERDFKRVGDFHYGEMEMHRRGSPWRQWVPFSWHNLYRVLSGYSERPLRAFIWLLLLIPAWAVLVWWLGIYQAGSQNQINYWDALLFIFEKATLQRPPWPAGITWLGKFLGSLSVLLLPGQAALFILALRNRLGRRR
jgi:uncharacterized protein YjbI with pentapeptide repeats